MNKKKRGGTSLGGAARRGRQGRGSGACRSTRHGLPLASRRILDLAQELIVTYHLSLCPDCMNDMRWKRPRPMLADLPADPVAHALVRFQGLPESSRDLEPTHAQRLTDLSANPRRFSALLLSEAGFVARKFPEQAIGVLQSSLALIGLAMAIGEDEKRALLSEYFCLLAAAYQRRGQEQAVRESLDLACAQLGSGTGAGARRLKAGVPEAISAPLAEVLGQWPPGPPGYRGSRHFTAAELASIRDGGRRLAFPTALRLSAHLSRPCEQCWDALEELRPSAESAVAGESVVAALRTLTAGRESQRVLGARHRAALMRARTPEGFGFLLLEECLRATVRQPAQRADKLRELYPLLVAGDGLWDEPRFHDLSALFFSELLALHFLSNRREADSALELVDFHLEQGSEDALVKACWLKTQAQVKVLAEDPDSPGILLDQALELARNPSPRDCRAELLLDRAEVTSILTPAELARRQAYQEEALAIMRELPAGTNPELRVKVVEALTLTIELGNFEELFAGKDQARRAYAGMLALLEDEAELYAKHAGLTERFMVHCRRGTLLSLTDRHQAAAEWRRGFAIFQQSSQPEAAAICLGKLLTLLVAAKKLHPPFAERRSDAGRKPAPGQRSGPREMDEKPRFASAGALLAAIWEPPADRHFMHQVFSSFEGPIAGLGITTPAERELYEEMKAFLIDPKTNS